MAADYDLGTARGRIVVEFQDRATKPAEAATARVASTLSTATQRLGSTIRNVTSNFVSGFTDANAAASKLSGVMGTVGGAVRTMIQPAITSVGNFVSGFNDTAAAASALTGVMGTLGGRTRSALNPAITSVQNFVSGWNDTTAAASSFTGFMGSFGGRMRTAMTPAINTVGNFISGWNDSTAAASSFTGFVGTAGGRIRGFLNPAITSVQNFVSGFRDSSAAASSFTGAMGTAGGRVRSAFNNMGSAASSFMNDARGALSDVADAARKAASEIGPVIADAFRTAATIGLTAMAALAASVVATGVSYNSLEQTSRAAFTTILGSAEAAEEMMGKIAEFGKTSPFPRQAFISATQQMLGFGFAADEVIPILETINDAVAAMGGGAQEIAQFSDIFSRIRSQGRITGEEINRMSMLGVNGLQMLADAAGVSANEMRDQISAGAIDAETAITALTDGMKENFEGASENVKNTFPGAIDRVKGAWRDFSSAIVDPFVSKTGGGIGVDWANNLADLIRKLIPPVEEFVSGLTTKIQPALDNMSAGFKDFVDGIDFSGPSRGAEGLSAVLLPLAGLAVGVTGPLMANLPFIGGLFKGLTGPIGLATGFITSMFVESEALRDAFGEVVAAGGDIFQELMPAFQDLLPSIQDITKALGDGLAELIPALIPIMQAFADIIIALVPIIEDLTPIIVWLVENALVPLLDVMLSLTGGMFGAFADLLSGDVYGAVDSLVDPIRNLADMLGIELPGAFDSTEHAVETFNDGLGIIGDAASSLAEGDMQGLSDAVHSWIDLVSDWTGLDIGGWFQGVIDWVGTFEEELSGMRDFFVGVWEGITGAFEAVGEAWSTVSEFITETINTLVTWLTETWQGFMDFMAEVFAPLGALFESLRTLIDEVWRFITTLIQVAVYQIGNFMNMLWGFISRVWNNIVNFLRPIVDSIWSFISSVFGNIRDFVVGVFQRIWSFIGPTVTNVYNSIKTAFTNAKNAVTDAVKGLYNSVKTWITNAMNTVTGIKDRIIGALSGAGSWLVNAGKNVIQGFIDGITSMIDSVASTLGGITDNLANWKGPEWKDKIILEPVGELVMGGFIRGLRDGASEVKAMLQSLTEELPTMMSVGITSGSNAVSDAGVRAYTGSIAVAAEGRDRDAQGGDTYTIGDITISVEDLESIKTLEDFLDMIRVYKRQGVS